MTQKDMWNPHPPVAAIGDGRRILHIATRFLRGGAERNIAHFVGWERAAGFEVELAFGPDTDAAGIPDIIPVHELRWLTRSVHPLKDLLAIRELRNIVRRGRYDLVHTHLSKAGVAGRVAAHRVAPRVAHTVHMASFGDGYGAVASQIYRFAERRCAPISDVIAFVGNDLLRLYADARVGVEGQRMVIRSPIDLEPFLQSRAWTDERRGAIRSRMGIEGNTPLLLAIGVLERRKRYDLMLTELAPVLLSARAHLAIAGEGRERSALEALIARLGIGRLVHLLGHVDEVSEPMGAADLLVHASSSEGVAQVVIQALAAGRRVVALNVTGLREVAGAPISIVHRSGRGLAAAVSDAMHAHSQPASPDALRPWDCAEIDASISAFHGRIAVGTLQ